MSPELAGGFLTTAPPGKPVDIYLELCVAKKMGDEEVTSFKWFKVRENFANV